ncbi:protein singles bar isoform X2 [Homalodisca vitripennis]|uniref:protein singles bar isoform X2 n=1 Tax=Homalodisca vitripennis TaxID=197043 RepID=UPI001EE9B20D|nr:protein singles bar isoform X2 [Homalodisca vitripennis]
MMGSRGIPSVTISRSRPASSCCCLHLQFLQTVPGTLKLAQLMIGSLCESLLVTYGFGYSQVIGPAFPSLLTTTSSCLWTTSLLLVCYVFSLNSFGLIRSSVLEPLYNIVAAVSFLSSSIYMFFSVKMYLYPLYIVTIGFAAYPAMMAAYMLGFVMSILHGLDAYHAFRHYKGIAM